MRRTLLLTNDFPPRTGGIQSYLLELAVRLPPPDLVVYAPTWPGAAEFDSELPFPVIRHQSSLMLPVPSVAKQAAQIIADHRLTGLWFGAAAPLALLAPTLRKAGINRVVASTHGHEVGWSMLPGSRQALRRIGDSVDVVTYVSRYARGRISSALGPMAALEHLAPGVDSSVFRPDPGKRAQIRDSLELGDRPVVACISRLVRRKGQDMLVRCWPQVLRAHPEAVLLIVGDGPDADRLRQAATGLPAGSVVFTGSVPAEDLPAYYAAADIFAMPCRTRGRGLDVEGLGIVFLEASATGLPVVAGDSGGAPETVRNELTGTVVPGRDDDALVAALDQLLSDAHRRAAYGAAGRDWMKRSWTWQGSADRLAGLLSG